MHKDGAENLCGSSCSAPAQPSARVPVLPQSFPSLSPSLSPVFPPSLDPSRLSGSNDSNTPPSSSEVSQHGVRKRLLFYGY